MDNTIDYQELIGDRREFDQPKPQTSHRRLYQILAGIQIASILTVTGCALYAAGYFG